MDGFIITADVRSQFTISTTFPEASDIPFNNLYILLRKSLFQSHNLIFFKHTYAKILNTARYLTATKKARGRFALFLQPSLNISHHRASNLSLIIFLAHASVRLVPLEQIPSGLSNIEHCLTAHV